MVDDTDKRGASDRAQVAAGEAYEVDYFARKHGLTRAAAQKLISRIGNDRAKLDAAAEELSRGRQREPARRTPRRASSPSSSGQSRSKLKEQSPRRLATSARSNRGAAAPITGAGSHIIALAIGAMAGFVAGVAINSSRMAMDAPDTGHTAEDPLGPAEEYTAEHLYDPSELTEGNSEVRVRIASPDLHGTSREEEGLAPSPGINLEEVAIASGGEALP